MHASRRLIVLAATATATAMLGTAPLAALAADAYPAKPIRLVVPYPPGGPTDTAARIIGQALAERIKQTVIVDNKPGASGAIGIEQVVRSAPDGYTVGVLANPTVNSVLLGIKQSFDVKTGTTPIGMLYEIPVVVMVNEKALPGVTNMKELIAAAKASPKPLSYATPGVGSFSHLITESIQSLTGAPFDHISYKGSAPAIADVVAGHVPIMVSDMIAALPQIKGGKLRALAVASPSRAVFTPDVPTLKEQGIDLVAFSWGGLVGPPNLPKPIVERLNSEMKHVLADETVKNKLIAAGSTAAYSEPAGLQQQIDHDLEFWGKIVKEKGLAAQQ
ncbi:MAG: tripartite tricarboxylate transporter substrate binding protein [Burkholderiaceae bacterium]